MRHLYILFVFSIFSLISMAQNSVDNHIKWISDNNTHVTTIANAIAYELPYSVVYYPERANKNDKDLIRQTISYENYLQKIIKKPKSFKVRGFANNKEQFHFDTYIIEIKGLTYLLPATYVADNSVIDNANQALTNSYNALSSKISKYINERDSIKALYLPICEQKVQYYHDLGSTLPNTIDSIKNKIRSERNVEYINWYNLLPNSAKIASKKLSVKHIKLHPQNSVGGCDLSFEFTNTSPNKTIKYLYLTCDFYNAVNDIVICKTRYTKGFIGECTGPISPGESIHASWECVIYNWSARNAKINSIKIVYLDNSSTTISGADCEYLFSNPNNRISIDDHIKAAIGPYESQLSDCAKQANRWRERIKYFEDNTFYEGSKNDIGEYCKLFSILHNIEYDCESAKEEFEEFKQRNFMK